ncbi:hypothetical protein EDB81DRAFT_871351 [Dactylonectria macrodidyma]|uniref:DUF6570 domain-containing protein n=1 Tax=Dactylonectria macrodidyma TaxID=307937 RepID=A0A9P9E966_9HYPO|nr:hypothetical protein EDB81DRAFT_871351 [Dactylonectria macrodidyma]
MDSPAAKPHEAVAHMEACSSGGSALHQPPSQLQRPLSPRERGAPEAAGSGPPPFHRHFLPKERRGGDGRAARYGDDYPAQAINEPPRKKIRAGARRQRRRELQAEDLASESLSHEQTWCTPIPHERKVSTVRAFYKEFHDVDALPIRTCMQCYRQPFAIYMSELLSLRSLLEAACSVACGPASQTYRGLTPVEEKLIALNSCYGFVTRYSIASSQKQCARYPKHIKGHITVFPNNVQELATKVLPHPLVQVMEEIHVSWQGAEKPVPSDLSGLLSVRRRVVEKALVWLKKNNPHDAEIEIDVTEMKSWRRAAAWGAAAGVRSHGTE